MSKPRADAVIVGAGIAGCIVALALGMAGRRVIVAERAREVGRVGPDFIKPRGIEVLRDLGVLDELVRRGAVERSTIRYFHDGAPLIHYDFAAHTEVGHYLIVPYDVLLSAVLGRLAELPNVELWFAAEIRALADEGERVRVDLADGRSADASVVIGADGAHSQVRGLAGIAATRRSYEQLMFLATMPLVASVAAENRLYLSSGRWASYYYPVSASQMRVTSVAPVAEAGLFAGPPGPLIERLRQFVSESDDVLAAIRDTSVFRGVPLGCMHADEYHRGGVALVGNALLEVHPMTGQGMSLAMEDAAALGRALVAHFAGEVDREAALRRYSAERRPINEHILRYGDRLYRAFPERAAYLDSFDPRAHGALR